MPLPRLQPSGSPLKIPSDVLSSESSSAVLRKPDVSRGNTGTPEPLKQEPSSVRTEHVDSVARTVEGKISDFETKTLEIGAARIARYAYAQHEHGASVVLKNSFLFGLGYKSPAEYQKHLLSEAETDSRVREAILDVGRNAQTVQKGFETISHR